AAEHRKVGSVPIFSEQEQEIGVRARLLRTLTPTSRRESGVTAAAEEVDDREKDHRTEERDEELADAEIALVDGPGAEERREEQPAQERADDADDDVEDHAHLVVPPHDDAGEPAEDAADDQPKEKGHWKTP